VFSCATKNILTSCSFLTIQTRRALGLAELVRLRGPNGFRSGVAWAAFQGVRVAIIISAIQRRHATFLSSKEWCTIPWHPESKPAWQRVIDVTAQVPGLLERLDQIRQGKLHDDGQTESSRLLHHCLMLDRVLQAWYEGLPTLFGLRRPPSCGVPNRALEPTLRFRLKYILKTRFTARR
jgi:hypothetical protein